MNYKNLITDFVRRTIANLEFIELHKNNNVFEFTQLVNSLLGIVVLPKAKDLRSIPRLSFTELINAGWKLPLVYFNPTGINDLRNLIRVFRNSIAHFNIRIISNYNDEINGLIIYNKNRKNKIDFKAKFTLTELRNFINSFSKLVLNDK